ncbi:MAG: TrmH family RNA methyltransferase [Candidatus Sericytochromatia bacterium]|nr:TrmH family RNA methyltransferase [Candidatus Sericytochromatia bacterium]
MPPRPEMVLIAHNIRSLHNVGSLFRTCDGAGVRHLYLTGYSGFPPRKEISKTALGAENTVSWSHHWEIETVLFELSQQQYTILAVETLPESLPYTDLRVPDRVALILGNEVDGLEPELLEYVDASLCIPMYGQKNSLNVAVCGGVMLYGLLAAYRFQHQASIPHTTELYG